VLVGAIHLAEQLVTNRAGIAVVGVTVGKHGRGPPRWMRRCRAIL
jgi:hypothetical protein